MRFLGTAHGWPYLLTPFIPLAVVLELAHADAALVFAVAALGIVPTAALMGLATEELAARAGPGIGGLLNVTFGNAPELIIALFALGQGLHEVVKASIVGSILGNILLVMGAAMLAGGLRFDKQTFNATAANAQSQMLILAAAALLMPALFELIEGGGLPGIEQDRVEFGSTVEDLSLAVAIVLIATYLAGLLFSLRTHRDLFNPHAERSRAAEAEPAGGAADARAGSEGASGEGEHETLGWSVRRSVAMLLGAGLAVGLMSEILVGSIGEASEAVGLSEFFIGVIVVAIIGNAAEHWVAVLVAFKDKMDLAVNIAIGSSAQIALFVAPVLVLCSFLLGPGPMPLVFNGFELGAVLVAVVIAQFVTHEGESNWFEGVQLLAVYAILGLAFYYA